MQGLSGRGRKPAAADGIPDRRRPGRVEYTNPHLIALLRRQPQQDQPDPATASETHPSDLRENRNCDDLSASAGIGLAVLLSFVAWAGLFWALPLLFGR